MAGGICCKLPYMTAKKKSADVADKISDSIAAQQQTLKEQHQRRLDDLEFRRKVDETRHG